MPSSYSSTRSIAIIDAWLNEIQSFNLETKSRNKKRARKPRQSLRQRKRIALFTTQGNVMKRGNRDTDDNDTPKRQHISIYQDDTPRAGSSQLYSSALQSHSFPDSVKSITPSTDSATQSSISKQSGKTGSIKGLGSLMMTETPVERSDNISDIPVSGRDLYRELLKCKAAHQVLPDVIKAGLVDI